MPPCERAVDFISLAFDKHDFLGGKVDGRDATAGQRDASSAILVFERARERQPLSPAETMPVDGRGYDLFRGPEELDGGVRKVTEMLDNSRR